MVTFEFDETKNQVSLKKHGIDFIDAQLLWNDPRLLKIPEKTEDEPRYLIVGVINNKHWSAVITY